MESNDSSAIPNKRMSSGILQYTLGRKMHGSKVKNDNCFRVFCTSNNGLTERYKVTKNKVKQTCALAKIINKTNTNTINIKQ